MNIIWKGAHANNFQVGRAGNSVKKIVIHWIVGSLESADATFQKPDRIASAHYGIGDKDVHQYVKEEDTAYHCGNLTTNRQSIGIEHEGGPDLPISEATYKSSAELVASLCRKYAIPVDRTHIIKHSEVKATQCPGTFDIDKLISMVLAIIAPVAGPETVPVEKGKLADLERCKDAWNQVRAKLNVEDNVTVVLGEIDKLIKYEDAVVQKDRQLTDAQEEINSLKAKVIELTASNEALVGQCETLQKQITEEKNTIISLSERLITLEKQITTPVYKGWKAALIKLIQKL